MKLTSTFIKLFLLLASISFLMTSCNPEDPEGGEEEITTVVLKFNNNGPTVTWKEGEPTPTITLDANTAYTASVEFLNEEDPNDVEDVTAEIREEDDEHLVCYEVSGGANVTVNRTDSDGTFEIGLATEWTTTDASTGQLILKLRHQPGVKDGSCDVGESDVEADFNLTVQ
ncbi:MAG: hypothetical protein AAFQ83_14560 [Bacteroidota bacterium]